MIRIQDPIHNVSDEVQNIADILQINNNNQVATRSHLHAQTYSGLSIYRQHFSKLYLINTGSGQRRFIVPTEYSVLNTWLSMNQHEQQHFLSDTTANAQDRDILINNLKRNPYDLVALVQLYKFRKFYKITKIELTNLTKGYCSWEFIDEPYRHLLPEQMHGVNPQILLKNYLYFECRISWGVVREEVPNIIQPYSTRAEKIWPITKRQQLLPLMGIELELDAKGDKNEVALKVHKLMKHHCILKSDNSVPLGFEIVSKPAELSKHLQEYEKLFPLLQQEMIAKSNCGMHIHINRKGLSFLQLAKLGEFINSPDNLEFITKIAGRKANNYCMNVSDNNINSIGRNLTNGRETFGTRHVSLNFTNSKTIEFRMFAATTDFDVFARNLQFVAALREYTSPGRTIYAPKDIVKVENFLHWLKPMKRTYPQLVQGV